MMIVNRQGVSQQVFEQPDGFTRLCAQARGVKIAQDGDYIFLGQEELGAFIDSLTKLRDGRGGTL
jgi:hypothetical protein